MALPLRYNWRNLFVRKSNTALTFGVVALIVFVLAWALGFGAGMRSALNAGGSDDKLIVIKPGATGESTSLITKAERDQLIQLSGLLRDENGRVLVSGELCSQVSLPRLGSAEGQRTPVAIRGIEEIGFAVHPTVRIVEGRRFDPGQAELIVGRAIAERVQGLEIGDRVMLGSKRRAAFEVVGLFDAGGGPLESEVWGSVSKLMDALGREVLSSVALRIADPAEAAALIEEISGPPYQLDAKTERRYYDDIADKSAQLVQLTLILVLFMACGACFAVANTIYAAVDGRSREIAMLRTIGYSRGAIVAAFLLEAVLICSMAGLFGIGAAMFFQGQKQDFMAEATWSTIAYEMEMTPLTLGVSMALALGVGIIGAAVPAVRASRVDVITGLRQG